MVKILLCFILPRLLSMSCFSPFSDGKFGAYMQVHIQNDGPVTIELESPAATVDPKQVSEARRSVRIGGLDRLYLLSRSVVFLLQNNICFLRDEELVHIVQWLAWGASLKQNMQSCIRNTEG